MKEYYKSHTIIDILFGWMMFSIKIKYSFDLDFYLKFTILKFTSYNYK